jgi:hypothetical protein
MGISPEANTTIAAGIEDVTVPQWFIDGLDPNHACPGPSHRQVVLDPSTLDRSSSIMNGNVTL